MATILIVDDRPINREVLVTLLRYFGHCALEASSGMEALALARVHHPELVIADLQMPVMSGQEFLQQLRADPELTRIPIILYTATYKSPEAQALGASYGVFAVLAKPESPETIVHTVNAALGLPTSNLPLTSANSPSQTQADDTSVLDPLDTRLATVVEASLDLALEHNPEQMLKSFIRISQHMTDATYGVVGILAEDDKTLAHCFSSVSPDSIHTFPFECPSQSYGDILHQLVEGNRSLRYRDVPVARLQGCLPPGTPDRTHISSFLGVPIYSSARTYGWLALMNKRADTEFNEIDERLCATLATQVAAGLENARLLEQIRGYVASLEWEVEERKRVEQELERNRHEQLQLKNQFFSHISHELRSPLTAIYQFTTILLDGMAGALNPEQHDYLEIVLRNVLQLRTMIDDLLTATRADTNKLIVEPSTHA